MNQSNSRITNWESQWESNKTQFGADVVPSYPSNKSGISSGTLAALVLGSIFVGTIYGEKVLNSLLKK